jgi:hypothetical protein
MLTASPSDSFGSPSTSPSSPHVWVTMADSLWARTGTAALHTFVERLNVERRTKYGSRKGGVRDTKLVVMCLDEGCVEEVSRYRDAYGRDTGGGYAYGGYMWNRPDKVRSLGFLRPFSRFLPRTFTFSPFFSPRPFLLECSLTFPSSTDSVRLPLPPLSPSQFLFRLSVLSPSPVPFPFPAPLPQPRRLSILSHISLPSSVPLLTRSIPNLSS